MQEEWVKDADFERCEQINYSHISDHYKTTESDLIYKLPLHGSHEVYIYILLEFQSRSEHFMALRVLNYLTDFYMDYVKNVEERKRKIDHLPPILAESYYDVDMLKQEFLTLFDHEPDKQAVSLLLNWFQQMADHDRIEKSDIDTLSQIYRNREEVQSMLVNALARERKQIYEKGLKE